MVDREEIVFVKKALESERGWRDFEKKYKRSLETFVGRKVENRSDVEEIVQDSLWAIMNSLADFEGRSSLFSWICAIANRKVIDFYRKKRLKTILFSAWPEMEEVADKALGPEGESLRAELKEEIKEVFELLSEGYGKIIRLKYIEGLKIKKIARILGAGTKATESRLGRARKKFVKIWEKLRE